VLQWIVKWPFGGGEVCCVTSLWVMLERVRVVRAGRPALPRCADAESGDKMIDGVLIPLLWLCGRSVFRGRPGRGRWRQAPFGSRPQTIVVTTGRRAGCVKDQAAAATTSSATGVASIGASASSPSSRRMWYARRQSLRATERQARL
jgi:hypothetical protein